MMTYKKVKAVFLLGILAISAISAIALGVSTHAHASGVPYAIGDVFVGVGAGKINHYDSSGNLKDTLDTSTGCNEDLGMAFDPTGNLYATASFGSCYPGGHVVKFDNKGNLLGPFGSGYSDSTESIVIDGSNNVYVGQPDGTKALKKFDSAGNFLQDYFPAVEDRGTDWNDLAADQCTMFYTSEGSSVKRFNTCTNTQGLDFATGLSGPCYALRILPNGQVLVACSSQVYRLDPAGNILQTYVEPASETSFFFALNLDPDGTDFWTAGYASHNVYKVDIATGTGIAAPKFTANTFGPSLSGLAIFGEPTAAQSLPGRMTGGGTIGDTGTRHGFELHCNITQSPNNLEVNWGKGNKFHLDTLSAASCSDDPNITPTPPAAGFNTYTGKGTGTYNGVAGATAEWTFTDAGEPGTKDTATIKITDVNGNIVLNVSGKLSQGNQQAHNS